MLCSMVESLVYSITGAPSYGVSPLAIFLLDLVLTLREACERSVIRFSGQRYKGYYTKQEALDAWDHANAVGNIGPVPADAAPAGPSTYTNFSHVLSDEEAYWAVLQGLKPGVYRGL